MEKICKTCKRKFKPKDDRPSRPAKFCSRACIRNRTIFKKGHSLTPKGNKRWDNPASKAMWFKKGEKPLFSYFGSRGWIPWNKGMDFGGIYPLIQSHLEV